jgi:RNA polymerase sigma-70 factor (family 1)
MENSTLTTSQLIADSYVGYHRQVYLYILHKVNSQEEAEDLSQDVFLRLMEYKQMLRPDTVKFFIYTISRNLVNDYLRRYYKKQEISSYMYDHAETCTSDMESRVISNDLAALEQRKLSVLPAQRRKIYTMSRFEDKSIADISSELNLSHRTVENHLRIGRHEIREYIRQCI